MKKVAGFKANASSFKESSIKFILHVNAICMTLRWDNNNNKTMQIFDTVESTVISIETELVYITFRQN